MGVYRITHKGSGLTYIGASRYMSDRVSRHRTGLRGGYHPSQVIQRLYNDDGMDSLEFAVVSLVDTESDLYKVEHEEIMKVEPELRINQEIKRYYPRGHRPPKTIKRAQDQS